MKSTLGFIFVLAVLLSLPVIVSAQDDELLTAREVRYYSDGSLSIQHLYWDNERKRFVREHEALDRGLISPARIGDAAVVSRLDRWESGTKKIIYGFTPFSIDFRKDVKKVMNKYVNRRRGNKNVPKLKAGRSQTEVTPLEDFNNIFEYQRQFNFDGRNLVVMTEDDNFFRGPFGNLMDPDLIARTMTFANATVVLNNGRWEGTFWISETDTYLRSDFFDRTNFLIRSILSGSLRFGLGYTKPIWVYDLNSDSRVYNEEMFENTKHEMWKDVAQEWDRLFYADKLVGASAVNNKPIMMPNEEAVLDLADYRVPFKDPNTGDEVFSRTDALFVTNLKAYDDKDQFSAKFTAIIPTQGGGTQELELFTIKGNLRGYPRPLNINGGTEQWFPVFFFNQVGLGDQDDLDALNQAILDHGTPLTIDNATYNKALKVEVQAKGQLQEDGKSKQAKKIYYFVNSNQ